MLPFAIILYDLYFSGSETEQGIKNKAQPYFSYFIILGIYVFLRMTVFNFAARPLINAQTDIISNLLTSAKAIIIYIGLILFPFKLHMERTLPVIGYIWSPAGIISVISALLIIAFTVKLYKNHRLVSFGLVWFLLNLIPVSGIFMPTKKFIIAEHWLYLASIGFFIFLGAIFEGAIKRNKK